jgi:hypothetical protein
MTDPPQTSRSRPARQSGTPSPILLKKSVRISANADSFAL